MSSERTLTAEGIALLRSRLAESEHPADLTAIRLLDALAACEQERDEARRERDDLEIEVQSLLKKIGVLSDRMWAAEAALAKLQALRTRIRALGNGSSTAIVHEALELRLDLLALLPVDARQERR